jgi:hypothetical protein
MRKKAFCLIIAATCVFSMGTVLITSNASANDGSLHDLAENQLYDADPCPSKPNHDCRSPKTGNIYPDKIYAANGDEETLTR